MIDEPDKAHEPPSTPDKPNESDKPAKTVKRFPWWLRSSLWFALGTITSTVIGLVAFILPAIGGPIMEEYFIISILSGAGVAALSALPFAAWAGFRAKNAINWKACGLLLPLACGFIYPLFAIAISRRLFYSMGDANGGVSIVVCTALLLVLAEFCVRLQPFERPWYQYTLRSLVIFMAAAGLLFACLGEFLLESYKHQQLEAKWSKLGAISIRCSQGNPRRMVFVDISFAALKDLEKVTSLEILTLHYNKTTFSDSNLESVTHMEHLSLTITGPQVGDLSPLEGLVKLEVLTLYDTPVSDLSPLEGLTNLKELDLRGTPFSKEEILKLQKALPNCNISWDG